MASKEGQTFALPNKSKLVADLFTTQEQRDNESREKVMNLPLSEISGFPNHPFKVRVDSDMMEMVDSIKQYGVLVPGIVRPKESGGYELVAGHRRHKGSQLAKCETMPCIVRNLSDDEATIIMVDSNLQRERILPSEKAFAYNMRMEAMKRQGQRTDITSVENQQKSDGKTSRKILSEQTGEKEDKIRQYVALTKLIPELLNMVDNWSLGDFGDKDTPKVALLPASELAQLSSEHQMYVLQAMELNDNTPSHAQARKMNRMHSADKLNGTNLLTEDEIHSIMSEQKSNQVEQFKIPKERLTKYFPTGTSVEKMQHTIVKALELYRQRERSRDAR